MNRLAPLSELFSSGHQTLRSPAALEQATFSFVGDISLIGGLGKALQSDASTAISKLRPLLAADVIVGNLETPLSQAAIDPTRGIFTSDPAAATALFSLGFHLFNLANNHTMDCAQQGLEDTLRLLQQNNIRHVGAGLTVAQARQPAIVEINKIRFGILGYSQPELDGAAENVAGVAPLRKKLILEDIEKLKPQVDVIIVSLHEGYEFQLYPRQEFIGLCRELAQQGVAMIYGHHPHVLQGMETHGNCLILYSLGNFLFDMPYNAVQSTREGLIAKAAFDKDGITSISLVPTYLDDDCQARGLEDEARRRVLANLKLLSANLDNPDFIREQNRQSVQQVLRAVLGAVYQFGQEDDREGFDKYFHHQIRRDPYLKVFRDYAALMEE